jgi:hypothetical protein
MRQPLLILLLIAALPAHAQQNGGPETLAERLLPELQTMVTQAGGAINDLSREVRGLMGDADTLFAGREMSGSRVVKGAPYCADAVNESVQTLADGNRIVKKSTTRWCRDSEGRTRQETERGERKVVYVRDPVAGKNWSLDPQNKTATQMGGVFGIDGAAGPIDSSAWREYAERMREWARGLSERIKSGVSDKSGSNKATADPVVITESRVEMLTPDGKGSPHKDVYVIRMHGEDTPALPSPPVPPAPPLPPAGALPAPPAPHLLPLPPLNVRMLAPRGQGVQTSLGSKDFEGVRANGEKTTWTIEAGKFGNEKPIVIVSEKWTSPELMLTVYARDFDPRSGETLYKLTNLKRGEPDASLFKVPADFKVRESKGFSWTIPSVPPAPSKPAEKG